MRKYETARINEIIEKTVRECGVVGRYEVNVYAVTTAEMKRLGKKWLGDEKLHEVISFPMEEHKPWPDGVWRLGEIVILESELEYVEHWVEHGTMHLLGVHHAD
jgi:ssRNA-specific RNase YbeY (16S rRNA maturation enzyme)